MKRILSIVLALCMVVTLLPMTALAAPATYVSVGGVMLTYEGTPVYATTNASGAVTTDGATAENYNVKFENDANLSESERKTRLGDIDAKLAELAKQLK